MNVRKRNHQIDRGVIEVPLSETETTKSASLNRSGKTRSAARRRNEGSARIWFLTIFLFSVVAFYVGLVIGWSDIGAARNGEESICGSTNSANGNGVSSEEAVTDNEQANKIVRLEEKIRNLERHSDDAPGEQATKIAELEEKILKLQEQLKQFEQKKGTDPLENKQSPSRSPFDTNIFDKDHTGKFVSGIEFIDRKIFAANFDTGVPLDESEKGNDRVAILYSDDTAFPEKSSNDIGRSLSVEEATSNCDCLHLVFAKKKNRQCIAIMGQYESFHVHKFMRVDGEKGKIDSSLPLRYASRGHQENGRVSHKIPLIDQTKENWDNFVSYLQSLDTVQEELKPVLKEVSSHNDHNAVIVLVCNFGQSDLLLNFVCNARAKGLEDVLSNIILFATDEKTHDLAKLMGITSVYLGSIFGNMPEQAARRYADQTFRDMMLAKVYCIHLVSMLGHDILFQDVDVVWYQNPLAWFHDSRAPYYGFDMYFQDDGNHSPYYAPYSANTGLYYVRNNEKTQYFFNSLLTQGDRILASASHQNPLIIHLSEQASLYGLRVKIWNRDAAQFPGGYNFHSRKYKAFLKDLMSGGAIVRGTLIFHMSWTSSKVNKVKLYQQMGEWYLNDTCANREASGLEVTASGCCAAEPILTCHFRDKASKIPCKDSPPMDKNGRSFW